MHREAKEKLWFILGSAVYPEARDAVLLPTTYDWLKVKQGVDKVNEETDADHPHLWRIHDHLYDFSKFQHPGGNSFLEITRNTDITELFESQHVDIEKARAYLAKYFVKKAKTQRNSACFTFNEKGFYATLRRRVFNAILSKKLNVKVDYVQSVKCVHDSLLVLFMGLFLRCMTLESGWLCILTIFATGCLLSCVAISAHNFFHQKDNWRMYSFDLTLNSSHEWRISHVYSHHAFANTMMDYEIAAFEPFCNFLDYTAKTTAIGRLSTFLFTILVFPIGMHATAIKRVVLALLGGPRLRTEHSLPLFLLLFGIVLHCRSASGLDSLWTNIREAVWRSTLIHMVCSAVFLHVGLAAGHHLESVWHASDPLPISLSSSPQTSSATPNPPSDKATVPVRVDWGSFQLVALVGEHPSVDSSTFLTAISFGRHALHHLFPTLDHGALPALVPLLHETLVEFGLQRLVPNGVSSEAGGRSLTSVMSGWQGYIRTVFGVRLDRADTFVKFPAEVLHRS